MEPRMLLPSQHLHKVEDQLSFPQSESAGRDICYYCYTFANKHKILSNSTNNTRPADREGDINDEEMIDSDADENVRELVKILDNIHLDKLDSASSKVDKAKELLWTDCFGLVFHFWRKHVSSWQIPKNTEILTSW